MEDNTPPATMHLPPPVPIKTYRWEDLRRARVRGGYPWTHLDKPPMDDEAWKEICDHEYEPIAASPPKPRITDDLDLGPDEEFDDIKLQSLRAKSETSSTSSRERRFLRGSLEDELVYLRGDGEDEDEAMGIRSMEGENEDAEVKVQLSVPDINDDRNFTATPSITDASRTDYDVNTSQLDSMGLEDIPLKKEAKRSKSIDHEYEPIAAPPPKPSITDDLDLGPDEEFDAINLQSLRAKSETSSTSSRERRFLRGPLEDELVYLRGDGEDEDEAMGIRSMEGENEDAEVKVQLSVPDINDDRNFTATPSITDASRTDYDVNTSQLDSMGLEDIPLKTEAKKSKSIDHEYEPIAAPPPKPRITEYLDLGPDEEFDAIKLQSLRSKSETSSTSSRERRFLRGPLEDELVYLRGDGEDEDEAMGIRSMEGENGDAEVKVQLSVPDINDDRNFTATPSITDASRTDYDVNTSQLDSSGLEDIPLKKEARKEKLQEMADQQAQARGFQQRLRSQAGRIRTKLRNMPRPNIKLPERPKFNMPERPKFHLPERPKFNLPERPKFTMPDRPKFNFPERSKFHLPERPKFNMPERPKFNMPERPKFSMPQRPKISMPSMPNFMKDSKNRSRFSSTRRPLRDRSNLSSASTASSSQKNLFHFTDLKSYPRIFDRKSRRKDYATSSPKATRGQTPPPEMPSRKKGRWLQRFTDLKYGPEETPPPSASEGQSRVTDDLETEQFREDIDMHEGAESVGRSESTSAFRDKDYGYALNIDETDRPPLDEERHRMQASSSSVGEARSSGSSSLRHRAGVLEEIDSDEFFLREKGLSQEDVEVGRYLTSEIRDAFRAPVSALSQMDNFEYYDDEEDVDNLGQQYRSTPERGPTRPARTRSLRPSKSTSKSKERSPAEVEDSSQFFNTFPPARPSRKSQSQQRESEQRDQSKDREGYEQDMEIDEEPAKREIPSFTYTADSRQQSTEEPEPEAPTEDTQWHTEEHAVAEPPIAPKRLRRSRKEPSPDALCNGHYTKEDWLENLQAQIPREEVMAMRTESDYIIPAAPPEDYELTPEPPRRGRRRSSRATSLADEDRTSRGASSLPSERDHATDDFPVDLSLPEIPGYASIEKPSTRPRKKTSRPSAPGRRKRSVNGHSRSYPHFYSLPHRPQPIRPLRNYSTLGPSRPPRRHKAPPPVDIDRRSESYIEIEDDIIEPISHMEEMHGSARDLQSGEIVRKMKGRPLPPPPRPPRKGREARDEQEEEEMDEDIIEGDAPLYKDDEMEEPEDFEVSKEPLGALSDKVFYAKSGVTSVEDEEVEEELRKVEEELRKEEEKEQSPLEGEQKDAEEEEEKEVSPVLSEEEIKEATPEELEFEVEEVEIGIQTDPLPDDVCVVTGEEEVSVSYATVSTETTGLEKSPPKTFEFGQQTIPEPAPPPPEPTIIEKPIPYYVMPDPDTEVELKASKLQVAELDVERLNVGELQAQKIKVSDIDGMSLQVTELTSRSGNLVVSGLELPPGFLQELVDSLPLPSIIPQPPPQAPSIPSPPVTSVVPVSPVAIVPTPIPAPVPASQLVTTQPDPPSEPRTETITQSRAAPELSSAPEPSPEVPPQPSEAPTESSSPSQPEAPTESIPSSQPASTPTTPSQAASSAPTQTQQATPLQSQQTTQIPQQIPTIPIQQSIPQFYPGIVTSIDGLHSYLPEYIPSQIPVSVRVPSRTRSHHTQRELESEEEMVSLMHTPSSRRRRHHLSKPVARYSSDEEEEEEYASYRPPSRRHHSSSRGGDASIGDLSRQLVQACQGVSMRALNQLVQYVQTVREGDDKRRDLQLALCILLLMVAGLILMGYGSGKTYHTHHWDYQFPPRP